MIDCTDLGVVDGPLRARLLHLARLHTPPLHLRVTPVQLDALGVEVIAGHAYLGDVPVTASQQVPPPRPIPPVEPPVVDLDEAKAGRVAELQLAIRSRVDEVLPRDAREMALADYCDLLFAIVGGGTVDGVKATALMAQKGFTLRARAEGARVEVDIASCTTVDAVGAVNVDFVKIGGL